MTNINLSLQDIERTFELMCASEESYSLRDILKIKALFPIYLPYLQQQLKKTDPALFPYLNYVDKKHLRARLKRTYHLLWCQYRWNKVHYGRKTYKGLIAELDLCHELLLTLDTSLNKKSDVELKKIKQLQAELNSSKKPLKYCGIYLLAPAIEKLAALFDQGTLSTLNVRRLYLAWGNSFLGGLFSLINTFSTQFFYIAEAEEIANKTGIFAGYLSFVYLFTRLGINLLGFSYHLLGFNQDKKANPDDKLTSLDIFTTQWEYRKYPILNDILWGPINCICFYKASLPYMANFLTLAMLGVELCIACYRLEEERTKHAKSMFLLRQKIEDLSNKIKNLKNQKKTDNHITDEIKVYKKELEDVKANMVYLEFEYRFKRYKLINDIVTLAASFFFFGVACCFLCPIPVPLALVTILGIVGTAICFICIVINAAVEIAIDLYKSAQSKKIIAEEVNKVKKEFQTLKDNGQISSDQEARFKLTLKALYADSEYQRQMIIYQSCLLIRTAILYSSFPAIAFCALIFMPLPITISLLVAIFIIGVVTKLLIDKYFKPEEIVHLSPNYNLFSSPKKPIPANKTNEDNRESEGEGYLESDEEEDGENPLHGDLSTAY